MGLEEDWRRRGLGFGEWQGGDLGRVTGALERAERSMADGESGGKDRDGGGEAGVTSETGVMGGEGGEGGSMVTVMGFAGVRSMGLGSGIRSMHGD